MGWILIAAKMGKNGRIWARCMGHRTRQGSGKNNNTAGIQVLMEKRSPEREGNGCQKSQFTA